MLVRDHADGGSLAEVLNAHSTLTPGEVVTLSVPLVAALTALHDAGVVHGSVTSGNVLFDAVGRPMLADYGVAAAVAAAANAPDAEDSSETRDATDERAAHDVQELAALLSGVLADDAPPALRAVLDNRGEHRIDAADLARSLRSVCSPVPVRLAAGAPVEVHRSSRPGPAGQNPVESLGQPRAEASGESIAESPAQGVREPPRQSLGEPGRHPPVARPPSPTTRRPSPLLLVGVPMALTAAVVLGRAWAAADRSVGPPLLPPPRLTPTATTPPQAAVAVHWTAVMKVLDQRRDAAIANLDPAALADVYAAGSPPLGVETASIQRLAAAGARADGLRLEIDSTGLVRRTPAGVTLRVVDRMPAYEILSADGRVLERRSGRGPVTWLVDLVPAGDGWRIAAIAPG